WHRTVRLLAITPWFPSEVRPGLGLFTLRDVELLSQDHEATVLHLHDPALDGGVAEYTLGDRVRVVRIPYHHSRPSTYLDAARTIRRMAADVDLIHTMAFPALLPTRLAIPRRPWVHTEHWSSLVVRSHSVRVRLVH